MGGISGDITNKHWDMMDSYGSFVLLCQAYYPTVLFEALGSLKFKHTLQNDKSR